MAYCYIHRSRDLSTVVWEASICKRCRLMQKPQTAQGTENKILQNVQSKKSHLYPKSIFEDLSIISEEGADTMGSLQRKSIFRMQQGKCPRAFTESATASIRLLCKPKRDKISSWIRVRVQIFTPSSGTIDNCFMLGAGKSFF